MKKLAVFAVAAVLAASAFANGGFYDDNNTLTIGGNDSVFTSWNRSDAPSSTDIGLVSDLTISSISFNVWDDSARGGANLWFNIFDEGGQIGSVGGDGGYWLGENTVTFIGGEYNNNYNVSWTGSLDLAAEGGFSVEAGKTYFVDMWLKTYGDGGDTYYGSADNPYRAQMTTPAVPEPATMSLLGLGALAMVLRRKLRK